MTNSLDELKSGKLIGSKRLKLACGLSDFPEEIISLADTLEVLDLSGNKMSELPDSIASLKKLKIIFFGNNSFTEFPKILASCPALSMVGFKSNKIECVPENAFPPLLRWLIPTDNNIKTLPKSIGECHLLQKCALAGNQIKGLPSEMANCTNLELLRLSANALNSIPNWLFELPKLSWVAFSGNPAAHKVKVVNDLDFFDWDEFTVQELLGEGASGLIYKAIWNTKNKEVAIKVFKGDVTSDGLPDDEMEVAVVAGAHGNLVPVLGKIENHPQNKIGLIMELIPPSYVNLGNPPSLVTCTRDTFSDDVVYTGKQLLKIAKSIASVCCHLHSKGINHGDLYSHNILLNSNSDCLLGDYGAASFYDVDSDRAHCIERAEVRAFGCLLEDVLNVVDQSSFNDKFCSQSDNQWKGLIASCTTSDVNARVSFSELLTQLNAF